MMDKRIIKQLSTRDISPFPRPTRVYRRPKLRQQAATNYESNLNTSTLCRLPLELILHIAAFLSDVDILALSLSCRQMRFDLAALTSTLHLKAAPTPTAHLALLYERLRKDRYASVARKEKPHAASKKLLCASCHAFHPTSHFYPRAFVEPALTRVCTGSRDRLRICGHRYTGSTTFPVLHALTCEARDRDLEPILLCPHPHRGNTTHYLHPEREQDHSVQNHHDDTASPSSSSPPPPPRTWFLVQRSDILDVRGAQAVPSADVRAALVHANRYLCPHVHSSNELLFHRLYAKLLRRQGTAGGRDGTWTCDPARHGELLGNCRWRGCETWYSLFVQDGWLRMEVRRELGPLVDPNLGIWKAQLEGRKMRS